jgi:hypothetical protein
MRCTFLLTSVSLTFMLHLYSSRARFRVHTAPSLVSMSLVAIAVLKLTTMHGSRRHLWLGWQRRTAFPLHYSAYNSVTGFIHLCIATRADIQNLDHHSTVIIATAAMATHSATKAAVSNQSPVAPTSHRTTGVFDPPARCTLPPQKLCL